MLALVAVVVEAPVDYQYKKYAIRHLNMQHRDSSQINKASMHLCIFMMQEHQYESQQQKSYLKLKNLDHKVWNSAVRGLRSCILKTYVLRTNNSHYTDYVSNFRERFLCKYLSKSEVKSVIFFAVCNLWSYLVFVSLILSVDLWIKLTYGSADCNTPIWISTVSSSQIKNGMIMHKEIWWVAGNKFHNCLIFTEI